jgi:nonribosomal peptide synthetase DhbF
LEGPSATYNAPNAIWLDGELDRESLRLALSDVVARHESLRTVFQVWEGVVYQRVLDVEDGGLELPVIQATEAEVPATLARLGTVPFDLSTDRPFRAHLLALSERRHVLLLVMHHIVTDGASDGPLYRDLGTAYRARIQRRAPRWEPLPVQYADYAAWHRELLGDPSDPGSESARQLAYWSEALAGLPEEVVIPVDRPRPVAASYQGVAHTFRCSLEVHSRLLEVARETGTTLFMVVQAATAVLLSRMGAGDDIPIGVAVEGRADEALEDLVGFFVNTVVLRTKTGGNPSFRTLLRRVRETDLAAWSNQDVPFDWIVGALNPDRFTARNPLFQVLMALEDGDARVLELPGLATRFEPVYIGAARFDLTFVFTRHRTAAGTPGELEVMVEGTTDLYEAETIRIAAERLSRVLDAVAADPDVRISAIDMLSARERHQILTEWNGTARAAPSATLVELFEAQAARTPDAIAVVSGDRRVTYEELNAGANRLARLLSARGAGPESLVAVLMGRSAELAVALLAVLKSGAAYLPIDPDYPAERVAALLNEARPTLMINESAGSEPVPGEGGPPRIVLDDPRTVMDLAGRGVANLTDADRGARLLAAHPAYVIYTSGSTGRPKGVTITHGNVVAILDAAGDRFSFGGADVWSWFHSYAFDVSVWEMWGALAHGGSLVTVPFEVSRSPKDFLALLARERVTILSQTPSAFYPLIQEDARTSPELPLKSVVFAGEALDLGRLRDWYARHPDEVVTLVNMYGITETTIHATYMALDEETVAASAARSLVGRPLPGLRIFVLDEGLRPVPVGAVGELYVVGAQLARGYLNQPGLTAERFVACPFEPTGGRMYRSGDLARWTTDGQLEYMGRVDDQVKVRGFRVELGDIQAVLTRNPQVAQGAVVVREDLPGDKRLVAYAVPADDTVTTDELHGFLRDRLPDYMVPSVITVGELPLTPNGKLDRGALLARTTTGRTVPEIPRTPVEEALCDLVADVLNVPHVGVDDNFFNLGGHSLLAVLFLDRIKDIADIGSTTLTIRDLYRWPTVAQLAEQLATRTRGNPMEPVLTMREGSGEPLFCLPTLSGLSWIYSGILPHIDEDRPVIGLQSGQLTDPGAKPGDLGEIADAHVALIRRVQPDGPYHLMGWSFGGLVAYAVATRLEAAGERVATLALLDTRPHPDGFRPMSVGRRWVMSPLLGDKADELPEPATDEELIELLRSHDPVLGMLEPRQVAAVVATTLGNGEAFMRYRVEGRFSGNLVLFSALRTGNGTTAAAWAPYVQGTIEEHGIDCGHMEMIHREPLRVIGELLDKRLSR